MKFINFEDKSESYPIVLIPKNIIYNIQKELTDNEICNILNIKYPTFDEIPIPKEPTKHYFTYNSKTTLDPELGGCGVILFGLFILLALISIILLIKNLLGALLFLSIFTIVVLWIFDFKPLFGLFKKVEISKIKELNNDEYETLLSKYKESISKIDFENNSNKTNYKLEKEKIDKLIKSNYQDVSRKFYKEKLQPILSFRKLANSNNRGKSEIFFLSKLHENFNTQIFVDIIPSIGKNPFQPDFLIVCNETNFHIDIEIDEPYSVEKGLPIHHDRSNDNERNDFFNEINWGVIRFTEKQIIENTYECINLIQNVLYSIRNKENSFSHEVPLYKKWTYEEALIMSNNGYRNTYLPNNMKININYNKDSNSFETDGLPF